MAFDKRWDWELSGIWRDSSGLRIFDFHPIYIALNTRSLRNYEQLKKTLNGAPWHQITLEWVAPLFEQKLS